MLPVSAARRVARASGSAVRKTLTLGLRPDDGADVAALDDDPAVADDLPLQLQQPAPDGGHGAHRGDGRVDLVGADRDARRRCRRP